MDSLIFPYIASCIIKKFIFKHSTQKPRNQGVKANRKQGIPSLKIEERDKQRSHMTKSIHCAQLLAKSHSANYSSLTRNEHISQSASIRCSLWTNPNTLQPNPAPSWKKTHHIEKGGGEGGVFRNRGMQERKKRASRHSTKPQKQEKKRDRENNPPNQKRQTQKAIHVCHEQVHQSASNERKPVIGCCQTLLGVTEFMGEREKERCICYMSQ